MTRLAELKEKSIEDLTIFIDGMKYALAIVDEELAEEGILAKARRAGLLAARHDISGNISKVWYIKSSKEKKLGSVA